MRRLDRCHLYRLGFFKRQRRRVPHRSRLLPSRGRRARRPRPHGTLPSLHAARTALHHGRGGLVPLLVIPVRPVAVRARLLDPLHATLPPLAPGAGRPN